MGVEDSETPQHTLTVSYADCWIFKKESNFSVLLTVQHLSIILAINQLNPYPANVENMVSS